MGLEKEISMKRRASQLSPLRRLLVLVGALIGLWSAFSPLLTDWSHAWAAETSSTICRIVGAKGIKEAPTRCKRGDIVLWALDAFDKTEDRLAFVAAFTCDFSKAIVLLGTQVTCIYTDTQREFRK